MTLLGGGTRRANASACVPLNPIQDAGPMLAASDALIDLIRGSLDELPFPLAEELELWLLDRAQTPLALLATAISGSDLDDLWRLYPQVLDPDLMARARVEARLLRANS